MGSGWNGHSIDLKDMSDPTMLNNASHHQPHVSSVEVVLIMLAIMPTAGCQHWVTEYCVTHEMRLTYTSINRNIIQMSGAVTVGQLNNDPPLRPEVVICTGLQLPGTGHGRQGLQ